MKPDIHFCMKLARTVFEVDCLYESTMRFCADYLVAEPVETAERIVITPEHLEAERARLLRKKRFAEPLEASTPEALEILVLCRRAAELSVSHDTVLFHGSSLAMDGQGVIFTAVSGTGKSTHTGLWRRCFGQRVEMVNDDKPFLNISDGQVRVFGTPWRGKHRIGSNISAPVRAICVISRSPDNSLEPISRAEAFPLLLQQTYYPENPQSILATLKLLERLLDQVPVFRVNCNMDPDAAETAWAGLKQVLQKEEVL